MPNVEMLYGDDDEKSLVIGSADGEEDQINVVSSTCMLVYKLPQTNVIDATITEEQVDKDDGIRIKMNPVPMPNFTVGPFTGKSEPSKSSQPRKVSKRKVSLLFCTIIYGGAQRGLLAGSGAALEFSRTNEHMCNLVRMIRGKDKRPWISVDYKSRAQQLGEYLRDCITVKVSECARVGASTGLQRGVIGAQCVPAHDTATGSPMTATYVFDNLELDDLVHIHCDDASARAILDTMHSLLSGTHVRAHTNTHSQTCPWKR
jgi:hypothetical protein